ncbi:uncharacterized protein RHOBADRAFT_50795 [Rhodotorula graminis WP1]|uniref:Zn(2)-C6 fungal-type domain-containing protein n=1 Tax=Rhodotorula graminis (strain WP1) TaxID=578459 RepID=A0A194SCZ3_RHOGW|nr:uncharacterized protein RHOBADRAFT_50795 [Rhodotorula graminis WP1]KPV78315.1 hypothetical protein RHOBADRAFT_50795 [Rhodotorula graminis WP1]
MSTPRGEGSSRSADAFDGSTQLDSASGPIEGFSKLGAKISCLACRAAKRKCSSVDPDTICKRCSTHKIPCEYKRHRRGRKKKAPDASQWPAPTFNGPSTVQSARLAPSAPPFYPSIASTSAVTLDGPAVGCARSQAPPGLSQDQPVAPASYTLPVPPPLGGRRVDIQFSHVVPTGDSMPFVAGALNAAPPPAAGPFLPTDCPDPVHAGILTERDAIDLFKTYFSTMNLVVPVLDPALHSPDWVRHKSALLFTAVITVTAKAERPKAYHACVLLSNKLVGQAVEFGLSTIEVVQSLLLLTHWKQPNDSSSWRKVGYAIRMAQELRLHVRAPRPLPEDEHQAREVLNKERAWLNLVVADYHLAIHHSLPRMISEEDVDDPADWVLEHADKLPCPGESTLPPWITFSRLCRQYADTLADMTGDPANTRSLKWLENDWRRWRSRWLGVKPGLAFLPPQISALRLCDAFFRFHIAEWKLLWVARYSKDRVLHVDEPSELSSTFCECVDASLALAAVFQNDFVVPGYLSFCFNLSYVALAVVSVWLVKNIVAMSSSDRDRVIRTLNEVRSSTEDASPVVARRRAVAPRSSRAASSTSTQYDHSAAAPEPTPHSAHYLHLDRLADADTSSCAAFPWSLATQQIIQENLYAPHLHGAASTGTSGQGLGGGPPFDNGVGAQDAFFEPGSAPMSQDDMLFPAADDDIWRLLFPITDTYPA